MKAVSASERTVRSACFPGTSDPSRVFEPERSRTAERRELERVCGGKRVGSSLARPCADDRGAHLVEHVERRSRGGAVGRDAHADARLLAAPSSGATPQPRIAFERGQCATATSCSARSAISSSSALTQCAASTFESRSPASASARMPVVPERRHEHLGERLPRAAARAQELASPTRSPRDGSRSGARARRTRGRARSCRCREHAARCPRRTSSESASAIRSRIGSKRSANRLVGLAEDLEVDDRRAGRARRTPSLRLR